jgi:hypothetical protein
MNELRRAELEQLFPGLLAAALGTPNRGRGNRKAAQHQEGPLPPAKRARSICLRWRNWAICHCPRCQKQSGAPFSLLVAVPKGSLRIEGQTLKTFDDIDDSGLPVRRRFCGNCSSPIMSYVEAMPDLEFIKAGTVEDTSWLNPTMEVWCEAAQPWSSSTGRESSRTASAGCGVSGCRSASADGTQVQNWSAWPGAAVLECPLLRRYWGISGHRPD